MNKIITFIVLGLLLASCKNESQIITISQQNNSNRMMAFYGYKLDTYMLWDRDPDVINFVDQDLPPDFFSEMIEHNVEISPIYINHIRNILDNYKRSQEPTAYYHGLDVYFILVYPEDCRELVYIGDRYSTKDVGDILIEGKYYKDTKNIGELVADIIAANDSTFRKRLDKTPYPIHSKGNEASR